MTVAFYMNCVSTHQLPLAREIVNLIGANNFRYIDAGQEGQPYQTVGHVESWITKDKTWIETADVVLTGIRALDEIEIRAKKGLKTYYYSERWFKPIRNLPGWLRLLVPSYRKMVKRFVKWVNSDPNARVLAIGPWAKKDFLKMGIKLDKIVDWGYYVKPSDALPAEKSDGTLKLLWCGRLLGLKRVGDIVRAVGEHVGLKREGDSLPKVTLTIVGDGPEKAKLVKMAEKINFAVQHNSTTLTAKPIISFMPGQTPDKIREIMREHDTFVFASNAYEGWGAVVSEALEEGMKVIGTYESGASAAILPHERLYHAGDVKALTKLIVLELEGCSRNARGEKPILPDCSFEGWKAVNAARRFVEMMYE